MKFLKVLLGALLNKAYSLLNEDVQIAIYHMASRNNQIFFDTFLPEFVGSLEGVIPSQGQELLKNFQREEVRMDRKIVGRIFLLHGVISGYAFIYKPAENFREQGSGFNYVQFLIWN